MQRSSYFVALVALSVLLSIIGLGACSAPAAPSAAPTKAPAAAAPTAAAPAAPAATTAPAASQPTKPAASAPSGQLGPMPQLQSTTMQFVAGGVGGGWYNVAAAIGDMVVKSTPALQLNVVPGAGIANNLRVAKNEVPLALGFPPLAKAMMDGTEPYKDTDKNTEIRGVIAGFSNTYLTLAVADEVPFTTFDEFIQKKYPLKIAVDRVGTTDEWSLRLALAHYGLTYEDLKKWGGSIVFTGYGDQATNMKDKHVDALWENISAPSPTIQDVATGRKLRVIPLPDAMRKSLVDKFAFADKPIPAGAYGNDKPIPSVASLTTLYTNSKVADDPIYVITRIICEDPGSVHRAQASAEDILPETAWKDTGATLHPGAARYFKEKGFMK